MPLAKITSPGLIVIALCVAVLWGCIIGERVMVHRATAERLKVQNEMRIMQRTRHPIPVSAPTMSSPRHLLVLEG